MTRYRLPAELGGGEYDGQPLLNLSDGSPSGQIILDLGSNLTEYVVLRPNRLTEVPPPIPTEPEPGAYQIGEHVCVRFVAPDGVSDWAYPVLNGGRQRDWEYSDFDDMWTMLGGPEVTIRRLVPESDPLPEVTLPWTGEEHQGDGLRVERYDATSVSVAILGRATSWMTLGTARELAAALIAAASTQDGAS